MNECPCLDLGEDFHDDLPVRVVERVQRARKAYHCAECRGPIAVGDLYEYVRGLWDGSWSTFRTCAGCYDVRRTLVCGGWTYGELWNDLREAEILRRDRAVERCYFDELNEAGAAMLKKMWWREVADA